ncbi:bifunctional diguanylate cyclase/phosphodiesterase [Caldimonas sp. KR1-144]|uniref:bifunctional diguanylate cyclase/phosphodiesterase n=1 Tax=Caldimonas sp. KR1-144 TaxID=3400911 RepID=UPI003C006AB8
MATAAPAPSSATPASSRRRPRRLRTYLGALVAVILVPALGTAAVAVWRTAQSYRDASASRLVDTAHTLAHAVQRELAHQAALMETLAAGAEADARGGVQGRRALRYRGPDVGRLGLFTAFDEAPPDAPPADFLREAARAEARPLLSNLYFAADGAPRVAFALPRAGGRELIALEMAPQRLVRLAPQQGPSDTSLLVAVTDGSGRIVARSRDGEKFVGRRVPDWDTLQALRSSGGLFEARTTEGAPIMFAFRTLDATPGWVLVVGEPLGAFNARWHRPLIQMAIGGGAAVLLALLVAGWLGRQILRPVWLLQRDAQRAVGDDKPAPESAVPDAVLPIREFESMRSSIESAQAALRQRAQALAQSELRYRTLAQAGALVLWRAERGGGLVSVAGWEALTGLPELQALGSGWFSQVHPEDRASLRTQLQEAAAERPLVDAEFRLAMPGGQWRWVRARGSAVPSADGRVSEWVGVLEDVHERRSAQMRIAHLAHHDALTGLPNRTELRRRLEAAIERAASGRPGALLYIDLDRFKEVNDSLGHPVGDALLRVVTQRLASLVREADAIARLGGDEFVVVQSSVQERADAAGLAARIVDALSAGYELDGHHVVIGASVGICLIGAADDDPDRLLSRADLALYRAKSEGRGRFCFFDGEMEQRMQARRALECELRDALDKNEFELVYRPLRELHTGRAVAAQAAPRWNHPQRGPVAFDEFAFLADEIGLAGRIMGWAVQRACADAQAWPRCPRLVLPMASSWVERGDALAVVRSALQRFELAPQRLELSFDEALLLRDTPRAVRLLRELRALGVRVAIARFGSGSFELVEALHAIAPERVTIEPALCAARDDDREALRAAAIGVCRRLGIGVAVEGVDDAVKRDAFAAQGCVEAQGALFGGYAPAGEVEAWFAATAPPMRTS